MFNTRELVNQIKAVYDRLWKIILLIYNNLFAGKFTKVYFLYYKSMYITSHQFTKNKECLYMCVWKDINENSKNSFAIWRNIWMNFTFIFGIFTFLKFSEVTI